MQAVKLADSAAEVMGPLILTSSCDIIPLSPGTRAYLALAETERSNGLTSSFAAGTRFRLTRGLFRYDRRQPWFFSDIGKDIVLWATLYPRSSRFSASSF
jgi:hypothetical protein